MELATKPDCRSWDLSNPAIAARSVADLKWGLRRLAVFLDLLLAQPLRHCREIFYGEQAAVERRHQKFVAITDYGDCRDRPWNFCSPMARKSLAVIRSVQQKRVRLALRGMPTGPFRP